MTPFLTDFVQLMGSSSGIVNIAILVFLARNIQDNLRSLTAIKVAIDKLELEVKQLENRYRQLPCKYTRDNQYDDV